MPSPAAINYRAAAERALILARTGNDRRLRPISTVQAQAHLHASLASEVAAWDAYIHNVVRDFFLETANPLVVSFTAVHDIARRAAEGALDRLNTPNWDNARNTLASYTGYDPIGDWVWPARGFGRHQVKERLDQILRVRHSFAHGFSLPAYPWTQSVAGRIRLTLNAVRTTHMFFENLVKRTDKGLARHMSLAFGKRPAW